MTRLDWKVRERTEGTQFVWFVVKILKYIGGNKMKLKTMKLTAAFIAALFLVMGCAGGPKAQSSNDGLDAAMRKISDYLNERIPKGNKVVFLNVKSDWPDLSEYILSGLSENAVNDRVFSVVDRQQLDSIRAELNFQWSGEVSDKSAQEIGQMLGAQTIVSGAVTKLGDEYRIQVRAITVKTAEVQGQTTQTIDGKAKRIVALTKKVVPSGSGGASSGTSTAGGGKTQTGTSAGTQTAQPAQPAKPANGTYTFRQRPQAYKNGIPIETYIFQIVVRGNYFLVYLGNSARGSAPNSWVYGFNYGESTLTNLDNPARRWTTGPTDNNDRSTGSKIFSFQNVTGNRFSLENLNKTGDNFYGGIFEEFDLTKADYEP